MDMVYLPIMMISWQLLTDKVENDDEAEYLSTFARLARSIDAGSDKVESVYSGPLKYKVLYLIIFGKSPCRK